MNIPIVVYHSKILRISDISTAGGGAVNIRGWDCREKFQQDAGAAGTLSRSAASHLGLCWKGARDLEPRGL